jgi:hypothetical protein
MNKNIILIYHIPIDELTPIESMQQKMDYYNKLFTKHKDDFYDIYVLPNIVKTDKQKFIVETIDIENAQNNIYVERSLDYIKDRLLKIYEPEKWLRVRKLKNLIK